MADVTHLLQATTLMGGLDAPRECPIFERVGVYVNHDLGGGKLAQEGLSHLRSVCFYHVSVVIISLRFLALPRNLPVAFFAVFYVAFFAASSSALAAAMSSATSISMTCRVC